jgi:hypothetical protein
MGMQWQMGSTHLGFDDAGPRTAYQPRHAVSRRNPQPRIAGAPETGLELSSPHDQTGDLAAARCESYGFSPVSVRQALLSRAALLFRLHSRHQQGSEQASQQGWA